MDINIVKFLSQLMQVEIFVTPKVPTMVGFWGKSMKSDQMHCFGQNLMGFLSLGEILKKLVEILRFIFMKVYNISLSTLNMSVFHPVLPSTSVNQVDK